mgnify:CR=1 FL=1
MFLLFHGCKSDILIEVSGSISSINSCRTPTTVRKVHNLNPIAVKEVNVINFHIMDENAKILQCNTVMTMIIRMASASNTIPTIKATMFCFMEPKSSTESMIKSMAKEIAEKNKNFFKVLLTSNVMLDFANVYLVKK